MVELISGSSDMCRDTISQQVYLQSITADFNFISTCLYDSIQFNNLSYTNGDTINNYIWLFGDLSETTDMSPKHLYALADNYSVTLIAESNSGCKDTVTKMVEVYPVPVAGFDYEAEAYEIEELIEFTDLSTDGEEWQWSFGDGISSSIQNPQHIYSVEGLYTIIQTVSNVYNCVDSAETTINIDPGLEVLPPKLPTAFSPNDDGLNDVYYPRGGPFKSLEFKIYNSWGKLIYSSNDLDASWDGKFNGIDQPIGVYVWTIAAVTIEGEEYVKTGDVNLIR
jgi:gliding motility-associated-like protein